MTTAKSSLDGYKMEFEDMPTKIGRVKNKQSKIEQKKAAKKVGRVKQPRKPSAFSLFFKYWIEVVTS